MSSLPKPLGQPWLDFYCIINPLPSTTHQLKSCLTAHAKYKEAAPYRTTDKS